MKSLLLLWSTLAKELADECCTTTDRDIKTVAARSKDEGFSFLTITLSNFGKDFERSLDQGSVASDAFMGFSRRAGLPQFLGGFLSLVFDRNSGVLLDEPLTSAIRAVRQLTLMFGKINLACSPERVSRAIDGYVECEQEVSSFAMTDQMRSDFKRIARLLYAPAFTKTDRAIAHGRLVPRHGPGSTADGLRGNAKYRQSTWPSRLDKYFPVSDYLIPNYSYWEELDEIDLLEPDAEIPAKVITVPKTLKTPRIIAMEPTAMQYAQQAIRAELHEHLESFPLDMYLGFDDQIPNQEMAREGSRTGGLATLDLSEASDRVSNQLVECLLNDHKHLYGAVDACRSRLADVPGYGIIPLTKFASMGSALCFPMEAMVFLTLIFLGIERELSTPLTRRSLKGFVGQVRVYGDDLIVPVDFVHSVYETLESYGFKVNAQKSFWTGRFRESCGREYFNGEDVSIVRVREQFPTRWSDAEEVISLVSLRNQLYFAGYWRTVSWLDGQIRGVLKRFPVVLPTSPVLGRHSFLGYTFERISPSTHAPEVKGYVVDAKSPKNPLDGPGALLKFLIKQGDQPVADREHLERSGRPSAVGIKLRWSSAV